MFQSHPFQKFHDDERMTIVLPDLMDRADVGMVQRRGGSRLASRSFERLRVMSNSVGQEFQRNETPKLGVLGFIDDTHSTAAQLLNDAVVRDGLTDQLGRCGHWLTC